VAISCSIFSWAPERRSWQPSGLGGASAGSHRSGLCRCGNRTLVGQDVAPRSPWQNAYVERLIGSIRRECLDHMILVTKAIFCWVFALIAGFGAASWTAAAKSGRFARLNSLFWRFAGASQTIPAPQNNAPRATASAALGDLGGLLGWGWRGPRIPLLTAARAN
jgi:hypothetical protein